MKKRTISAVRLFTAGLIGGLVALEVHQVLRREATKRYIRGLGRKEGY